MLDDNDMTKAQLLDEVQALRERVESLESTAAEQMRIGETLRRSEEELRAVTETAADSIFLKDTNSRYTYVNPAMERTLGLPASELIGKTPSQLFSELDAAAVNAVDKTALEGNAVDEVRTLTLEGHPRTFHTVQTPLFDPAGKVRAICGIVRDVTKRELFEEMLRESEAKYRALFDQAPDSIVLIDPEKDKILEFNTRAHETLGYTREEFSKFRISDLEVVETQDEVTGHIKKIVEDGYDSFEAKHKAKDGRTLDMLINVQAISVRGRAFIAGIWTDITDRKRTDEALLLHGSIANNMSEAAILVRLSDGAIIHTNLVFEKMFGYEPGEMIGKPVSILNAPTEKNPEETAKEILGYIKLHGAWQGEMNNIRKDGTPFWSYATASTFDHPQHGKVLVSVRRDITERKRAEAALKESEERHRAIFEGAAEGILIAEVETKQFVYANPAICALLGYSEDEILSLRVWDIHPESDRDRLIALFEAKARGEICPSQDIPCLKKDGSIIYVNINARTVRINGKDCSAGFFTDLTERMQATRALHEAYAGLEQRVQERTRELSESNTKLEQEILERNLAEQKSDRLTLAIEQTTNGICTTDMDGIVDYANGAWAEMHGYQKEELLGKHLSVFHTEEQIVSEVTPFNELLMANGSNNGRIGHVTRSGKTFQTEMSCSLIKNSDGESIGMIGRARDITRELELESQLRHAQKMEAIGILAGGIAHNLRNSVGAVLGWIEIAADNISDNDTTLSSLDRARVTGRRATDLLSQLLKFSRKTMPRHRLVRPGPVVSEGVDLLRKLLPATLEIRASVDGNCGCIMADPGEIQQVIIDLGTNAAHAMNDKGVLEVALAEIEITSEATESQIGLKEGKHALLTLSDTGHGMDERILERAFEPFFTTKEPGEGTGLGLSIVHAIVKEHGGEIQARSEIGEGTSFIIYLPVCPEEETKLQNPSDVRIKSSRPDKTRVLLVDDDEDFGEMMKMGLEFLGYTVENHVNAAQAIDSFCARPLEFNVVVTDHLMPSITGMEVARRMRQIRQDVLIILLSGVSEIAHGEVTEEMGIREVLIKPATPRDLDAAIKRMFHVEE